MNDELEKYQAAQVGVGVCLLAASVIILAVLILVK